MKIFKFYVMLVCFLVLTDNVYARCNPLNPSTCVNNSTSNTFSDGVSHVYINNKCRDYVDIVVEYQLGKVKYWLKDNYSFSPGENSYLFPTANRYIYVTAKSSRVSNRKNYWKRKRVDLGARYSRYTYNLTCR